MAIIIGDLFDNTLVGGVEDDNILGFEGNDSLDGDENRDVIDGGQGNDTVLGGSGEDSISGGEGNDSLLGGIGSDSILGGSGQDTLNGEDGADSLDGGYGNDFLTGLAGDDIILGRFGNDTIDGGFGRDFLDGGDDNDSLFGYGQDDTMKGGSGDDYLDGGYDDDNISGDSGADTLIGYFGVDTLLGNDGSDVLDGGQFRDSLYGGAGNDTIIGDNGSDEFFGGAGRDTLVENRDASYNLTNTWMLTDPEAPNPPFSFFLEPELWNTPINDPFIGCAVTLSPQLSSNGASGEIIDINVTVNIAHPNVSDLAIELFTDDGAGGFISVRLADFNGGDGDNFTFTTFDDGARIPIGAGTAPFSGDFIPAESLAAFNGLEADGRQWFLRILDCKPGDAGTLINWSIQVQTDGTELDQLNSMEDARLTGGSTGNLLDASGKTNGTVLLSGLDGRDTLIGGGQTDLLEGGSGNDYLDGRGGGDTMNGGTGSDVYVVNSSADFVVETRGGGSFDQVLSSIGYILPVNLESLQLTGGGAISGTGNTLANKIEGNAAPNALYGLQGNDTLDGKGSGDTLYGGVGNDVYIRGPGDFIVENAGEGIDTIKSEFGIVLGNHIENAELTGYRSTWARGNELANRLVGNSADNNLRGMAGDDTLIGNSGADTLNGGTNDDSMVGGDGGDTYIVDSVGDVITEASHTKGVDAIVSSVTFSLPTGVESLELSGASALNGLGNSAANAISGNIAANSLMGFGGDDTLTGAVAFDRGKFDIDTLAGGADADAFVLGDASGRFYDDGAGATSGVADYALITDYAPGEDSLALFTKGSSLGYLLRTSPFASRPGSAIYHDSNGNNAFDAGDELIAVLQSAQPLTPTNVFGNASFARQGTAAADTLTGGAGKDTLTGLGGADSLVGGANDDVLDGSTGNDTMVGGGGNDSYLVGAPGDVVTEAGNSGNDTVTSSINYTLPTNVENLILLAPTASNGTGNSVANLIQGNGVANDLSGVGGNDTLIGYNGNDTLSGGTGSDLLQGGGGHDSLIGGTGFDTLEGGVGNDTYVISVAGQKIIEREGHGTDKVISDVSYTLVGNLENLELSGTLSNNGSGNGLNNQIFGNSGNNVLYGRQGNDTIIGGAGNDTLHGTGAPNFGVGEVDYLTGGAGADVFALAINPGGGAPVERYYDDGLGISGIADYAVITDYQTGIDSLILQGKSQDYLPWRASPVAGVPGLALYHDTNNNAAFNPGDELIAIFQNITVTDTITATYI